MQGDSAVDEFVRLLLDAWDYLTDAEKREVERLITNAEVWAPINSPQVLALESEADELFFGGAAGGGKALAVDTPIATPFGFRPIGDLRVGDKVLAGDGSHTEVIGVYPQGRRPLYRVTTQDGAEVLADADHRWNYSIARKGTWRKSGLREKVGTTAQIADIIASGQRPLLPMCGALRFTKSYRYDMRPIEPYALGLLLGDGYTAQTGPGAKWSFATEDPELLAALPGEWVPDTRCNYRLRGPDRPGILDAFARLGLGGCKASTKFIPDSYKYAPVESRIAVLQGLMDTDGTVNDGKAYFTSTSERLAEDVAFVVRSLGGRATVTSRVPACTNGAEGTVQGARAWTVYIRVRDSRELFRLQRKRAKGRDNGDVRRRIVSVEYSHDAPAVCIAVAHPSSLYVAGEGCVVTHNTDFILGLALTQHHRSIIYRREATQLVFILQRCTEIIGDRRGYSGSDRVWRFDDRLIEFGAVKDAGDETKYQGRPHSLKAFDEITHFLENQYTYLNGWKRTARKGERVRTIAAGNPPSRPEELWVKRYWGPWFDRKNPLFGKVEPAELAYYFVNEQGNRIYTLDPSPVEVGDDLIVPRSMTFVPSKVEDNPIYMATGYKQQLQSLPEPLRSQLLRGDFDAFSPDDPYQLIPTKWARDAMDRWEPRPTKKGEMNSMGVDPARGGKDNFVLARRHDTWFDELLVYPGGDTPDGAIGAGLITTHRRNDCPVHVDVIGVGASVVDFSTKSGIHTIGVNSSHKPPGLINNLRFVNFRSWLYWNFREALDPLNDLGLQLPDDDDLLAELCAHRFESRPGGIYVLSKDQVKEIIGRSPDKSDATVMAWIHTVKRKSRNSTGGGPSNTGFSQPANYDPYDNINER